MPVPPSAHFELATARINSSGDLTLTGTAWLPEGGTDDASVFVVVGRKTGAEQEYPAERSGGGQLVEMTGRIPLAALTLAGETLADLFFVSRSSGREARTRIAWAPDVACWIPYPTKFGNLSLKRKEA